MALNTSRLAIELKRARVPFLWLIFLILTFAITMVIIFSNLNFERPFEDRYKIDVAFESVKGVYTGQHGVRIAGVEVGVVSRKRLQDGKGVLTLSLEPRYAPIYKNARIRLRPLTPLQDMYVSIEDRGSKSAGEQRPGDPPISSAQTLSPVDISRVMNTFDTDTRDRLTVMLDQLGVGLPGNGQDLRMAFAQLAPFLHSADRVSEVMAARQQRMRRIITNFGLFADELAQRDRELNKLVAQGNATLRTLDANRVPLALTLREIPPTMDVIRSSFASLRSAQTQLDPALRAMRPAATNFESGLIGLQAFSREATPTFRQLHRPFNELRPLAAELVPAAESLESAFERFRPQAGHLDRISQTFLLCLDEAQGFFQDTLSVVKFGTPFGAIPRGNSTQSASNLGGGTPDADLHRIAICSEVNKGVDDIPPRPSGDDHP